MSSASPAEPRGAPVEPSGSWQRRLVRTVRLTDLAMLGAALLIVPLVRFGGDLTAVTHQGIPYALISLLIAALWWVALGVADSRSLQVLGTGSTEYRAVVNASLAVYLLVTTVSYLFVMQLARGYILLLFPLGGLLLLLGRRWVRRRLARARLSGDSLRRILLVGSAESVSVLGSTMQRTATAGYRPVALALPDGGIPYDDTLPALRGRQDVAGILDLARRCEAEAVALAGADPLPDDTMKSLTWALHEAGITLITAPSLLGVGSSQPIHQPLAGMTMIQIPAPENSGWRTTCKRIFDVALASAGLLVTAPLILLLCVLVRIDSPVPAIFRQERVGRGGRTFRIIKIRSMVDDAECRLSGLQHTTGREGRELFKMAQDPRITRMGSFLRRTSLDELPQLLNILRGDMSLVRPRPPLPEEVARYDTRTRGRLLVRPGLPGCGRSPGARTCPGTTRCAWTCSTWSSGRWSRTSSSWSAPSAPSAPWSRAAAPTDAAARSPAPQPAQPRRAQPSPCCRSHSSSASYRARFSRSSRRPARRAYHQQATKTAPSTNMVGSRKPVASRIPCRTQPSAGPQDRRCRPLATANSAARASPPISSAVRPGCPGPHSP